MKYPHQKQGNNKKSYYKTKSIRWSNESWERFNKLKKGTSNYFITTLLDLYEKKHNYENNQTSK